ncbi:MAG: serine hydrolase [Solibacteraceae bacterium]|nr:serine hydrolase [Solibacteraceae bacterium]
MRCSHSCCWRRFRPPGLEDTIRQSLNGIMRLAQSWPWCGARRWNTQGHGFADWPAQRPVDAERSAFRTGSVSKLITALVVLDQVRQGGCASTRISAAGSTGRPSPLTPGTCSPTRLASTTATSASPRAPSARALLPPVFLAELLPGADHAAWRGLDLFQLWLRLAGFLAEQRKPPVCRRWRPNACSALEMRYPRSCFPRNFCQTAASPHVEGRGRQKPSTGTTQRRPAGMHMSSGATWPVRWSICSNSRIVMPSSRIHPPSPAGRPASFFLGCLARPRMGRHDGGYAGRCRPSAPVPDQGVGYFVAVNASAMGAVQEIAEAGATLPAASAGTFLAAAAAGPGELGRFTGWYRLARYPRATPDKVGLLFSARRRPAHRLRPG